MSKQDNTAKHDLPLDRPVGEIYRSYSDASGIGVRLYQPLTSDQTQLIGTRLYAAPAWVESFPDFEKWYATLEVSTREGSDEAKLVAKQAAYEAWQKLRINSQRRREMVRFAAERLMEWCLPNDFSPDGGIVFHRESEYEHPVFGRTKNTPTGTNLFTVEQAKAMLEYVLEPLFEQEPPVDDLAVPPELLEKLDTAILRVVTAKDLDIEVVSAFYDAADRLVKALTTEPQTTPETSHVNLYELAAPIIYRRYAVHRRAGWHLRRYCVRAENSTREIFVGSKSACEEVRQELQTACADGAYLAELQRQHHEDNTQPV